MQCQTTCFSLVFSPDLLLPCEGSQKAAKEGNVIVQEVERILMVNLEKYNANACCLTLNTRLVFNFLAHKKAARRSG